MAPGKAGSSYGVDGVWLLSHNALDSAQGRAQSEAIVVVVRVQSATVKSPVSFIYET